MVLVTGATGLVGAHLLYYLAGGEKPVRALFRKERKLQNVKTVFGYYGEGAAERYAKIEWVQGDITNIDGLDPIFEGVEMVYHCAALISFDPSRYDRLMKNNQEGTANIVNLCLYHKVEKLCYVSSIATIGTPPKGQLAGEETEFNSPNANVYALSKQAAELEVWRGTQEGLKAVIVNPGVILGPGFWYGGSGIFFSRGAKRQRFYASGGTGFVSVGDVVRAMVLLMGSNTVNQRFILVAENLDFREVQQRIAGCFDRPPPHIELKKRMLDIGWRLDWLRSKLMGSHRILTKASVASLTERATYSNQKIKATLGIQFEPMEKVIDSCCKLFISDRI